MTPPDQTIQTQNQTPPPVARTKGSEQGFDDRIVELVRLLARRAAEHDYSQLLLQRESYDKGPVQ